jgi:hypothetical protein
MNEHDPDDLLAFTVASVWREARVSCPHPDLLHAFLADALDDGAAEYVSFHVRESQCPFCNATLEDFRVRDAKAKEPRMGDLRDRLMRSTVTALRKASGA